MNLCLLTNAAHSIMAFSDTHQALLIRVLFIRLTYIPRHLVHSIISFSALKPRRRRIISSISHYSSLYFSPESRVWHSNRGARDFSIEFLCRKIKNGTPPWILYFLIIPLAVAHPDGINFYFTDSTIHRT